MCLQYQLQCVAFHSSFIYQNIFSFNLSKGSSNLLIYFKCLAKYFLVFAIVFLAPILLVSDF